eukprot:COSAG02_NODE_371_length_23642_cov_21.655227_3_plen_110_part_00
MSSTVSHANGDTSALTAAGSSSSSSGGSDASRGGIILGCGIILAIGSPRTQMLAALPACTRCLDPPRPPPAAGHHNVNLRSGCTIDRVQESAGVCFKKPKSKARRHKIN